MFETLKAQPADKILALMQAYKEDNRPNKIDLGVGVYKDADGNTPVMRAVKAAEKQMLEEQKSKSYVALAGDPDFNAGMHALILGDTVAADRVASIATPGGTGAIRQGFELVRLINPEAKIWISNPTWPNHTSILNYLGMKHQSYRYFNYETCDLDFEGLCEDLAEVQAGDVVLVHGCCHNPTGANPTTAQWETIAQIIKSTGATVMIDLAYQGFGDGLEEDASATRILAGEMSEVIIAASCSKNFGIYRERTGILMAMCADAETRKTTQGTLNFLNRQNYSFPPDHGEKVVATILGDDAMREDWQTELEEMRTSMLELRQILADELRRLTNSDRFDFIARHRGMFSLIGATEEQVEKMRKDHGIYMVSDGRINIAGLSKVRAVKLAQAMVDAGV